MESEENLSLTAPEMGSLWTQYMFETMSICFFQYVMEHLEDKETMQLYRTSIQLSKKHLDRIEAFYKQENHPIPRGFTDEDVNVKAPRLYQDPFYLYYLYIMALQGLTSYSVAVSTSIRKDIRQYFMDCNNESMALFDEVLDVMLRKGLINRPPVLPAPKTVDFVNQQSYLTGWLGERRPLTAMEISDITFNMNKMHLHVALKVGFSQVAQSEKLRKYINRGIKMTNKQVEAFENIFREEKLNAPISWQSQVTDSTESPFSDKWIMYQVQLSTQMAIAFYGTAFSVNARRDLGAKYMLFISELARFVEDGANLMIDKGWFEQPPLAADRRNLTKGQKVRE